MTSSNFYKVWLWDSGASTWREVSRFGDMRMRYKLNQIPSFEATFYLTDSNLQDLMTAGVPVRVTKQTSSDGTVEKNLFGETINSGATDSGSRQIFVGTLNEPESDDQTRVQNVGPIIWNVTADGYAERIVKATVDRTTSINDTSGNVIKQYESDTSVSTKEGTIDSGDTINVLHRRENLLSAAIDIATLGDSTDNFMYYFHVDDDDADRDPRLNFYSPTNSLFETNDPFSGTRDDARIIELDEESRRSNTITEKKRLINAVQVTFGGRGSGTNESTTSFNTDTTSINNFSRREKTPYTPWIQDSSTAQLYRDTLLNMYNGADFNGNYDGIKRTRVDLRDGELFGDDFSAVPGDVVGIEDEDDNKVHVGRFLGFEYDQMAGEQLTVLVGIPRADVPEEVADTVRGQSATTRSMNITQTGLSTETTPAEANNVKADDVGFSQSYSISPGSTATEVFSISSGDPQAHGYNVEVFLDFDAFYDGGLRVSVFLRKSGTNLQRIAGETINTMFDTEKAEINGSYLGAADTNETSYDELAIEMENQHPDTACEILHTDPGDVSRGSTAFLEELDQHSIDLSHSHNM